MASKTEEIIKLKMFSSDYKLIPERIRNKIEIVGIDIEGFDYSSDEIHSELKRDSTKAYKKLKKREYELRQIKQL